MKRILALEAALLMFLCGCGEEPVVPARKGSDAQEMEQLWQVYFSMAVHPLQDEFTAPGIIATLRKSVYNKNTGFTYGEMQDGRVFINS